MSDLDVVRFGTDTSGRGIYMTNRMVMVWNAIKRHPDCASFAWKLTIVQGAFMTRNGGGAAASAGYHDQAGCLDVRTWNLSFDEINRFIRVSRMLAFAFWRRDLSAAHGGMDPHAHGTLGFDAPLSSGARNSWTSYLNNGDGLSSGRADYEWRPSPLVTTPPAALMMEDYFMTVKAEQQLEDLTRLVRDLAIDVNSIQKDEERNDAAERRRDAADRDRARKSKQQLVKALGGIVDILTDVSNDLPEGAPKARVHEAMSMLMTELANDPDIDGADKPA